MSTPYQRGTVFEHAVHADLRTQGYEVLRSAGSKSKVDLVAFKAGELLFVQCKRNGSCPPAERVELLRLAALVSALAVVAFKVPGRVVPRYWRLTGPGPRDRVPFALDRVVTP